MWVSDPDGARWEVYTVLADAPADTGVEGDSACCVPEVAETAEVRVPASARPCC